ncbi:MAG TPA: dienelactone hydrolase family protein [Thermoanaerobaculia bacterium]|nr:dienelactone hydrolase family protein [Thermoanaerobaculia bacterium]
MTTTTNRDEGLITIRTEGVELAGNLIVPPNATAVVLFAHGSGSSRFSTRNRSVAAALRAGGLGTLLIDLLTHDEELIDTRTSHLRFDIDLLARRLVGAAQWLHAAHPELKIGVFGASTGGGAALVAAAAKPDLIAAVVSRGGRPDLAGDALPKVKAPTLLIVGGDDAPVIEMNRQAYRQMKATFAKVEIVPGASHLFEEPGTLEKVAELAREWFRKYL